MKILLLNGPNLNLLGTREESIYGQTNLEELNQNLNILAEKHECELVSLQSNAEHELIDAIHNAVKSDIKVILINLGSKIFRVEKGARIAQMVLCPIFKAKLIEVETLEETDRGSSGFGSTGMK